MRNIPHTLDLVDEINVRQYRFQCPVLSVDAPLLLIPGNANRRKIAIQNQGSLTFYISNDIRDLYGNIFGSDVVGAAIRIDGGTTFKDFKRSRVWKGPWYIMGSPSGGVVIVREESVAMQRA